MVIMTVLCPWIVTIYIIMVCSRFIVLFSSLLIEFILYSRFTDKFHITMFTFFSTFTYRFMAKVYILF